MKYLPVLSLSAVLLASCDTMTAPMTTVGDFDPLAPPGGTIGESEAGGVSFKPGQFVVASIDNTAFFSKRPKGDGDADKLLPRDTQMKIIAADASYVKVELDSGEVGFVPSVMVNDPTAPVAGLPGDNGVYPPVEPLPTFDTSGLPPPGTIPPIIDPNAPVPPPSATDAPVPAPLPPGLEDEPAKPEEKKAE